MNHQSILALALVTTLTAGCGIANFLGPFGIGYADPNNQIVVTRSISVEPALMAPGWDYTVYYKVPDAVNDLPAKIRIVTADSNMTEIESRELGNLYRGMEGYQTFKAPVAGNYAVIIDFENSDMHRMTHRFNVQNAGEPGPAK